jgi:hypothetical protein
VSKSNVLENILLDEVLGGVGYTPAANVSVALYTSVPSDVGGGAEVSGGSYARVTLANNTTTWPAAAGGSKSNGVVIEFPQATADWGIVTGFGIFDDAGTPRLLYWGTLAEPREILEGDTPSFGIGQLQITED